MQQCTAYHLRIVSTCRPAGAKCSAICGTASIVGAWFPSPTGWVTQPLRVQASPSFFSPPLRSLRRCVVALKFLPVSRYHMSPLWGFPSPTGWVTQPLRVQASPSFFSPPLRSLRRCVLALKFLPVFRYHMSVTAYHLRIVSTCRPAGAKP